MDGPGPCHVVHLFPLREADDIHSHYFAMMIRSLHLWPEPQITRRLARAPWNPRGHDTDTCFPKQIGWRDRDFPQWFPNPFFLFWSFSLSLSLFNCVYPKPPALSRKATRVHIANMEFEQEAARGSQGWALCRGNGSLRVNDLEQIRLILSKPFARDTRVKAKQWWILLKCRLFSPSVGAMME